MRRDGQLQHFIAALESALFPRLASGTSEWRVARDIFDALKAPGAPGFGADGETLPAHQYLRDAVDIGRHGPDDVAAVADAFERLEPRLAWHRRKNAEDGGQRFRDGHANAIILGTSGLELRSDVLVGASLMAPGVQYVDHHHPPAEIYFVMTPGAWRQEQRPWHEPGRGGVVYNTPNIVHAMKSSDQPLLAVWCLLNR
ncbi:MAG TPA: dimethylsulfonioproprionate lyase family protein [Dongiaceae bacterium]|nr:dimethylsulfonioproprionate lyase family protein [Dongiaceae bacterium]